MRQRLIADRLLTLDGRPPTDGSGTVDIDEDTIVWSGPSSDAPPEDDRVVKKLAGLLMPGMINLHAHTPMVLLRTVADGLSVDRWLHEVIWPREARLTGPDVVAGMKLGLVEQLLGGITTTSEMYFYAEAMALAVDHVGSRSHLTGPVIDTPDLTVFGSWRDQIDRCIALHEEWSDNPMIDIGIGPHSGYSLGDEALTAVAETAVSTGMFIHTHVAEGRTEGDEVRRRTGQSVPKHLATLGLLNTRLIAAHCVWLDEEDIEILAANQAGVAHCPCSNAKHASGLADVAKIRAAGIPVGIATDGPSSHARLDLFEEMRTAIRLARVVSLQADAMSTEEALGMVTHEAAKALGRPDLGTLAAGAKGDMVLIDLDRPEFVPEGDIEDLIARVVWSGSPAAVESVWVGGRQLVDHQQLVDLDLTAITSEARSRAARLGGPT